MKRSYDEVGMSYWRCSSLMPYALPAFPDCADHATYVEAGTADDIIEHFEKVHHVVLVIGSPQGWFDPIVGTVQEQEAQVRGEIEPSSCRHPGVDLEHGPSDQTCEQCGRRFVETALDTQSRWFNTFDPGEQYDVIDDLGDPHVRCGKCLQPLGDAMDSDDHACPPTKQRPGDQRLPDADESVTDDQAAIIADIEARRQVGIERYGQGHRPFNGRDTLLDLYEEHLDALVYLKSIQRMAKATREELLKVVQQALEAEGIEGDHTRSGEEMAAEIAVDRIMGWVAAKIILGEGR